MPYRERHVLIRNRHRIYVREYPGTEPATILLHGFPDNLHLYDRLLPHLSSRRLITFDFLRLGRLRQTRRLCLYRRPANGRIR